MTNFQSPTSRAHGLVSNLLTTSASPGVWDTHISHHHGHLLQSWAWGDLKNRFGWTARRVCLGDAAAQILFRRLPLGFSIAYIPKGPVVDWTKSDLCHALFSTLHAEAKKHRAVFLKVEPDLALESAHSGSASPLAAVNFLTGAGFTFANTIQPRTTLVVDISGNETAILAAMKQKTRYNIRLAEKKGVTVRQGSAADLTVFYHLALVTARRDGFGVHSPDYYQAAYELFAPDRCALLIAEFEGEPLAALMAFRQGQAAYYFYGASANEQRHLMAAYLIQWAAIRWAKSQGCTRYDLWGIPNADLATLEAEFEQRHDGLWGVYRFKRGFGGQWARSIGAFDYVYNPLFYQLYKLYRR